MSCAGKGYGTNPQSNFYLYSQFYSSNSNTTNNVNSSTKNCRKYQGSYPSFTPSIDNISSISSYSNTYSLVYISGKNFLPNNTTFIKFGNYGYLPVTYYSSFNISFVVPLSALSGEYNVQVINIYNNNFSPSVNQSYQGNLNYSNSVIYTII